MKMEKRFRFIGVVLLIVLFGAALYWLSQRTLGELLFWQEEKITELEAEIKYLKSEHVPLRFKVIERAEEEVTVGIKFYDAQNRVLAQQLPNGQRSDLIVHTLPGQELSFDFFVVPISNKRYIAFPYRLYTESIAPKDGITLTSYYNRQSFPQIFYYDSIDNSSRQGLQALFHKIEKGLKNNDMKSIYDEEGLFGNMVHDLAGIQDFQEGQVYKIVARTKGGVEVMENER